MKGFPDECVLRWEISGRSIPDMLFAYEAEWDNGLWSQCLAEKDSLSTCHGWDNVQDKRERHSHQDP